MSHVVHFPKVSTYQWCTYHCEFAISCFNSYFNCDNRIFVLICISAIHILMHHIIIIVFLQDKIFGEAGSTIVIEEKLEGEEVSVSIHNVEQYCTLQDQEHVSVLFCFFC